MDTYLFIDIFGYYFWTFVQVVLGVSAFYLAQKNKQGLLSWVFLIVLGLVVFKTFWESWNWWIPYALPLGYIIYTFVKKKIKLSA